jgi:hypothetical protein
MKAQTTDTGNIIHMAALLGALSVRTMSLGLLARDLPFVEQLSKAVAQRAIGLGLVDRREDGLLAVSAQGHRLLREADVDLWRGLKLPKSDMPRLSQDSLRQRAWSAMRISGRFTIGTLITLAARDEVKPEVSLKHFVSKLALAGYLTELPQRARDAYGKPVHRQWRLMRDTGLHAPIYRPGLKCLFDPNIGDHVERFTDGGRHVA